MKAYLEKILLKPTTIRSDKYRYGMLMCIIALLCFSIWLSINSNHKYTGYMQIVVAMMLLINHISMQFRWSRDTMIILRATSILWTVFAAFYVGYICLMK